MSHTYTPVAILSDCSNQYSVALVDEAQGKQHRVVVDLNDKDGTKEPRIIFLDKSSVNVSGDFVRSFLALPNHNVLNPTQKKLFSLVQGVSDLNQKQRNKIAHRLLTLVTESPLVKISGFSFESASFVEAIQNVIGCLPVTKQTINKKSSTQMADMIANGLWQLGFQREARLLALALGSVSCGFNKSEVCLKKDYLSPDNVFFPAASIIHSLGPDYGIATLTLGENSFYNGIEYMRGSQLDFYNNQQVRGGTLAENATVDGIECMLGTEVQFDSMGKLQHGTSSHNKEVVGHQCNATSIGLYYFDEKPVWRNGSLRGILAKDQVVIREPPVEIRGESELSFHHNCKLEYGILSRDQRINGVFFKGGTELRTSKDNLTRDLIGILAHDQIIEAVEYKGGTKIVIDDGHVVKGILARDQIIGGILFGAGTEFPNADAVHLQGAHDTIKSIFADDTISREWEAWIKTQNPTKEKLVAYAQDLQRLKDFLGNADFQKIITTPLDDNTNNIIVRQTQHMTPPRMEKAHDTYQGIVRTDVSVDRLKNAIWQHGDAYGAGKIAAPYVACSSIERRISASRVIQQIVLDIPWPGRNLMTMNDTELTRYGAFGWEIAWTGLREKNASWRCLDTSNSGTDFNFNLGQWRLLPIARNKTIIWYATQSDSEGFNAPDNKAKSALRENILAFSKAADGYYGN